MARRFTWQPADGGPPIDLSAPATTGYRVQMAGTTGLSSPPYRSSTHTLAGVAGTTLAAIQADERDVGLGLRVEGATALEYRARWRALVRAFRPLAGDGLLTVTDEWGDSRHLTCRYVSGLEGDAALEPTGAAGRAVVRLRAHDPWFYGDPQTIDFGLAAPSVFFPIFPLVLSPSTIQGAFTVDLSDADAESYPTWTVTGPGTALVLTNATTGRSIEVAADLGDGQTMVIDTRPGRQSVRTGGGQNLMGRLSSDPALWPLAPGVNEVSALLTGAGPASRIVGEYRPRYAGI